MRSVFELTPGYEHPAQHDALGADSEGIVDERHNPLNEQHDSASRPRFYVRLHPGTKRPCDARWQSLALTEDQVDPRARGIHQGFSGEITVDEDAAGAVAAWAAATGVVLPVTRRRWTASGKTHLVYAVPDGVDSLALQTRIKVGGYPVDLLAGMRQAVGPGTVVGGMAYTEEAVPIQLAPPWLVALVEPTAAERGPAVARTGGTRKARSAAEREATSAYQGLVATLAESARTGAWDRCDLLARSSHLVLLLGAEVGWDWWDKAFVAAGVHQNDDDAALIASAARKYGPSADVLVPDEELWAGGSTEGFFSGAAVPAEVVREANETSSLRSPPVGNLPDEFWNARPVLAHIRAAAHSRACSADAVLGVLLARLASCVPGRLRVDTDVRTPTPLSMFSVLIGGSGTGKSSAAAVALALMPAGVYLTESHPLGSGEGLCDAYMTACKASEVPGGDPDAKGTAYVQTEHNAFFHADEGARVLELGKRSGSTLLPILRDAWSGGEFGQRNTVAGGKNRKVAGATVGAWIGLQQPHAAELLAGASAVDGTVQRFVWWASADPSIPDDPTPWPGPVPMAEHLLNETVLTSVGVADPIKTELRVRQVQRARGVLVPAAGREQDDALRVRLGALLALLEGRTHVTEQDWELALVLLDTSAGHVERVRAIQRDEEARAEAGRIGVRLRTLDAESDHADRTFDATVAKILNKITTRLADKPEGLMRSKLRESVARTRHVEFDAAMVAVEEAGLVRVVSSTDAHGDRIYPISP